MTGRSVPETASNASTGKDGRQFAPSTPRNKDAILALLKARLGDAGRLLEIASGTGEHVVHFAQALPNWQFQPSEIDPERLASIRAWIGHTKTDNVASPITLDAAQTGWGRGVEVDAISMCNLFHLISKEQARIILSECSQALTPNGLLMIYGPFKRDGALTSDGDSRFHASIKAHNPDLGYKNDQEIRDWIEALGFSIEDVVEMPANNLSFVARKTSR